MSNGDVEMVGNLEQIAGGLQLQSIWKVDTRREGALNKSSTADNPEGGASVAGKTF
jgi:hypothetical protein